MEDSSGSSSTDAGSAKSMTSGSFGATSSSGSSMTPSTSIGSLIWGSGSRAGSGSAFLVFVDRAAFVFFALLIFTRGAVFFLPLVVAVEAVDIIEAIEVVL